MPVVAIISGIIIFFARALKLDRCVIFIPKVFVHSFTLGVAFIIGLGQLDNILGLAGFPKPTRLRQMY